MVEPKKAGSLILARQVDSPSNNNNYDYQILFLLRNKSMTFANAMAFPGGKIEPADLDFITKNSKSLGLNINDKQALLNYAFRVSALRETYEETGLFLASDNADKQKLKALLESHKTAKTTPDFSALVNEVGIPIGEEMTELLRFVTPSSMKYRFDAQFFVCKAAPSRTFNIPLGMKEFIDIGETSTLEINLQESAQFMWLNPREAMVGHLSKTFELAPPQVLIINVLMSFKKFGQLEKYLKKIKSESKAKKSEDLFQTNPLTFPMISYYTKNIEEPYLTKGYVVKFLLPPDAEYPLEKIIEFEKSENAKEEYGMYYSKMQRLSTARCRLYLTKDILKGEFDAIGKMKMRTPLERIRSASNLRLPVPRQTKQPTPAL